MSSSVFFRFKSQKEPSRVTFDGTGISVFELKREIILISRLGDGSDFELILSSVDGTEEYDDDTTIIPRSTTVIAKRLPAARPGKGGAARYVSGKMPVHARNSHRQESTVKPGPKPNTGSAGPTPSMTGQTEEERMAAILQLGSEQWSQQKQEMASATPVFRPGGGKGKPAPDRPIPPGYVCYRCGEKGHWIQQCPTNDDPTWTNQRRLKRTTGIPKSFLKTVEKPTALADGTMEAPSGVMVNMDGDWVIAEPDKASWEQFQAKASKSAAAQQEADVGMKEVRDRGLACPIDKRLFVDPTKTPCCQTTYCNECITNALLDDGLQCPNCEKEGVLIDDLQPDTDMATKVGEYKEKKAQQAQQEAAAAEPSKETNGAANTKSPSKTDAVSGAEQAKPDGEEATSDGGETNDDDSSKKRKASEELDNDHKSTGPSGSDETSKQGSVTASNDGPVFPPELDFMNYPQFMNSGVGLMPNMGNMPGMPGMPDLSQMQMNMNMNMDMMNNMMFAQMMAMQQQQSGMGWPGMNDQQQQQQQQQGGANMAYHQQQHQGMNGVPAGPRGQAHNGGGTGAYFRPPLNARRGRGGRNF